MTARTAAPLGALLGVALVLRLAAAAAVPLQEPTADAAQYDALAVSLAGGHGFSWLDRPAAPRPPVYPAFLAAIYAVAGRDLYLARIAQGLVDVGTVAVVFVLARRFLGPPAGWLAAIGAATSPALVYSSTQLLSETLFAALLTAAIYLLLRSEQTHARGWAAGAGACLGAGALCRAVGVPLVGWLGVGGWFGRRTSRRPLLIAVAAAVLVVVPWTVRNAVQLGQFVPVSNTRGGMTLWLGSYEPWQLDWRGWQAPPLDRILADLDPDMDGEQVDVVLAAAAMRNIRDNPAGYVRLSLRKLWRLWHAPTPPLGDGPAAATLEVGLQVYHYALLGLFAVGLAAGVSGSLRFWLLLLVAYWTLIHMATMATARYLVPLLPLIYVAAGAGALVIWRASSRARVSLRLEGALR